MASIAEGTNDTVERKRISGGAILGVLSVTAVAMVPLTAITLFYDRIDTHAQQLQTGLQDDLQHTGFQGTVNVDPFSSVVTADVVVNQNCTLPGVIVDYTGDGTTAQIQGFDLSIYHPEDDTATNRGFHNQADLPAALGTATCAQAEAELKAAQPFTNLQ